MHDNSEIYCRSKELTMVYREKYIYCRSRIEAESKKNIADKYIAVDKYDYGVQQALRAVKNVFTVWS